MTQPLPPPPPAPPSIRLHLLRTLSTQQTHLQTLLSSLLPSPLLRIPLSLTYPALVAASAAHAEALEEARVFLDVRRRVEGKQKELRRLEREWEDGLEGVWEGLGGLEREVREAKLVLASIDTAALRPTSPTPLLTYAHHLAPYSSLPPTFPPTSSALPPGNLYPSEGMLRSGALEVGRAAWGVGEWGGEEVGREVGVEEMEIDFKPLQTPAPESNLPTEQPAGPSAPTQPVAIQPQQQKVVKEGKKFDLGLGDSSDEE